MTLSILFLTYNRPEMAKKTLLANLESIGPVTYELLVCDQGTTDPDFIQWLENLPCRYRRLNSFNEGVARSLNQLMLRARGDHYFFMPDDFLLPEDWGYKLVSYAEAVPNSGIVGFDGQDLKLEQHTVSGLDICHGTMDSADTFQVFGATLMTKELVQIIGGFCEDFHPYGSEDTDYCMRCILAGFLCYYIPGFKSEHIGIDEVNKAPKLTSFLSSIGLLRWRARNFQRIGLYEPLPIARDPFV